MVSFIVNDMTCNHCASTVSKAITSVDANAKVNVDIATKHVDIQSSVSAEKLVAAIKDAGYTPVIQ